MFANHNAVLTSDSIFPHNGSNFLEHCKECTQFHEAREMGKPPAVDGSVLNKEQPNLTRHCLRFCAVFKSGGHFSSNILGIFVMVWKEKYGSSAMVNFVLCFAKSRIRSVAEQSRFYG